MIAPPMLQSMQIAVPQCSLWNILALFSIALCSTLFDQVSIMHSALACDGADEPTSGLDSTASRLVMAAMQRVS